LIDKPGAVLYNYKVNLAHIAQLVEHVLGKNGVISSNLIVGFNVKGEQNG
jgi:hypothetical protein